MQILGVMLLPVSLGSLVKLSIEKGNPKEHHMANSLRHVWLAASAIALKHFARDLIAETSVALYISFVVSRFSNCTTR